MNSKTLVSKGKYFFLKGLNKLNKSEQISVHNSFGDRFHVLQSLLLCLDREVSIFTQAIKKKKKKIKVVTCTTIRFDKAD